MGRTTIHGSEDVKYYVLFKLAKMKIITNGRWLWTRTIGSTLARLASVIMTQWLVNRSIRQLRRR